jgi:hypothetical protein
VTRYGIHLLRHTFCSHSDTRRTGSRHQRAGWASGSRDHAAVLHLSPAAIASAIRLLDGDGLERQSTPEEVY